MLENLAWTLQVMALVVVGTGLLIGVVYDQVRVELGMLGVGAAVFLVRALAPGQERWLTEIGAARSGRWMIAARQPSATVRVPRRGSRMAQSRDEDVVAAVLAGHTERYEELVERYQGASSTTSTASSTRSTTPTTWPGGLLPRLSRARSLRLAVQVLDLVVPGGAERRDRQRAQAARPLVSMERPETEDSDACTFEFKSCDRGPYVAYAQRRAWRRDHGRDRGAARRVSRS
jgi:hypothetical protein